MQGFSDLYGGSAPRGASFEPSANTQVAVPAGGMTQLLPHTQVIVSSRWTGGVDKARKFPLPTSDDYKDWNSDQLRAECTHRAMKVPKGTATDVRRQLLLANDEAKNALREVVDGANGGVADALATAEAPVAVVPGSLGERCRLLNVLFDDIIIQAFLDSDSTPTRLALDAGAVGGKAPVWQRVADLFHSETPHLNHLINPDECSFGNLDRSQHQQRSGPILCAWWKDMNRRMTKALRRFRQSGEHDVFANYCAGQDDCIYLYEWLQVRPQAQSFVEGGMLTDTARNSIRSGGRSCKRGRDNGNSVDEQPESAAALNRLTSVIEAMVQQDTDAAAAAGTDEQKLQGMLVENSQQIVMLIGASQTQVS
eukprot:GHVU01110815.1.p1 GENE.GHVU01110815.1~~GHVU01110815.1.p1  ORF type:complete len:367 (+),score=36.27 GHVU01110815.1:485-1585(+)